MPEPRLTIALSGPFLFNQHERLIRLIEPLTTLERPRRVQLDLSGLSFVGPASLVTLVAALRDAMASGLIQKGSGYFAPSNFLVERYLDRIDFRRLLTGSGDDGEYVRREAQGFRPVTQFGEGSELGELTEALALAATEALALDETSRSAVWCVIDEIAKNVVDHASSAVGGFAMAQQARSRLEFEVAIADPGVGIRASLARKPEFRGLEDDVHAIEKALNPGVTSRPASDGTRGVGLTTIRDCLRGNGGTLLIRSGTAAVERGHNETARGGLAPISGTLVALRMRTDRPLNFRLS